MGDDPPVSGFSSSLGGALRVVVIRATVNIVDNRAYI